MRARAGCEDEVLGSALPVWDEAGQGEAPLSCGGRLAEGRAQQGSDSPRSGLVPRRV